MRESSTLCRSPLLVLVATFACVTASGDARPVTSADPDHASIVSVASAWRTAVIDRDVGTLAASTWPEYRPDTVSQLRDRRSELFRVLLELDSPTRAAITAARPGALAIFEKTETQGAVRTLAICYGSRDRRWPKNFVQVMNLRDATVFCSYWLKEPNGLFVSYSFASDPDD